MEKAEAEGVELPDELKKRVSENKKRRGKGGLSSIFSGIEDDIDAKDGKKGKKGRKGGLTRYE